MGTQFATSPNAASARLFFVTQTILLLVFSFHILLQVTAPFELANSFKPVGASLLGFWAIFAGVGWLIVRGAPSKNDSDALWCEALCSKKLLLGLLLVALIGLAPHIYSKLYLVQLRPISCLFEIRFAWLEVSHDMIPTHIRILSIIGHLLCSFAYAGVFISNLAAGYSQSRGTPTCAFALYSCGFFLICAIYSGFIGTRITLISCFILALAGLVIGICQHQLQWRNIWRVFVKMLLLPALLTLAFTMLVLSNRMFCEAAPRSFTNIQDQLIGKNDQTAASSYFLSNCKDFALHCTEPGTVDNKLLRTIWLQCPSCPSAILWFNHGIINFSEVLATQERGPPIVFNIFKILSVKLGFVTKMKNDASAPQAVYGPGGTTLPGAAYHDYHWFGLVLMACALACVFGFSLRTIPKNSFVGLLAIWLYALCFYVLFLSNMLVGYNIMPFPFIAFSLAVALVAVAHSHRRHSGNPFI